MKKELEEQYKEYLNHFGLEDTLEERADFILEDDFEEALKLYAEAGRDISRISGWKVYLNPRRLTIEEFCAMMRKTIDPFENDYKKIEGDKKYWPEEWLDKINDFFLD